MRIARLAFVAAALFASLASTAGGCLPLKAAGGLGFEDDDSPGGGTGGAGGGKGATIKTNTGTTGGGGEGAQGLLPPVSYAYLCGGSTAICVPGPTSNECAPGGNPNLGGGPPDGGSKLTCQLVPGENGTVQAKCNMAGSAGEGDPCKQATDCGVGLGCGETDVTNVKGVCRQYCCGDPEACPEKTHCVPTAMAEGGGDVPLCVQVKKCELLNDAAWCSPGETCTIVREDGTTSCAPEPPADQAGHLGDSCPCAAGFTCSNATGKCLKLCHVNTDECGAGIDCQGGTKPYPKGIGVCVF